MQDFTALAQKTADVLKDESPAYYSLLQDIGVFNLIRSGFRFAYTTYGKQISIGTLARMAREIFIHDERITNTMAVRSELLKTKCMLKTDFSLILAESLGIGRNKSQEFIDLFIQCGAFIVSPNILDTNAKMIRPASLTDEELLEMYQRICAVNGTPYKIEDFNHFKEMP
jgi:hypothetical protein